MGLRGVALFFLALIFPSLPAEPASISDENTFTADVARLFSTRIPDGKVAIKAPLTLSLSLSDDPSGDFEVTLDRVWAYCSRNKSDCERGVSDYVTRTTQMMRQQRLPIVKEKIMAVVRPARYVQGLRDQWAQKGFEPVAEPLASDIWILCMLDGEPAARVLDSRDLTKLNLSRSEIIALAKRNLEAHLGPIEQSTNLAPDSAFGAVTGDAYYAASRLLLHRQWAKLANAMKGNLIVTVPDSSVIFFADTAKPIAVQALFKASSETGRKSERPISPAILAWSSEGWQEWKR